MSKGNDTDEKGVMWGDLVGAPPLRKITIVVDAAFTKDTGLTYDQLKKYEMTKKQSRKISNHMYYLKNKTKKKYTKQKQA